MKYIISTIFYILISVTNAYSFSDYDFEKKDIAPFIIFDGELKLGIQLSCYLNLDTYVMFIPLVEVNSNNYKIRKLNDFLYGKDPIEKSSLDNFDFINDAVENIVNKLNKESGN